MAKSTAVQKQVFGVPSEAVLGRIESSDKVARINQAQFEHNSKQSELRRMYEAKSEELRDEFLSTVDEIQNGVEDEAA